MSMIFSLVAQFLVVDLQLTRDLFFCGRKAEVSAFLVSCSRLVTFLVAKFPCSIWEARALESSFALSPFSPIRDAARRVEMCKSESKKRLKNGCGSKVVEFSLNENYEH
jgi:hypothetical protein